MPGEPGRPSPHRAADFNGTGQGTSGTPAVKARDLSATLPSIPIRDIGVFVPLRCVFREQATYFLVMVTRPEH